MTSMGYALARAELIRALTAYSGITTSDGAGDGTTLIDANLIDKNDFITEKTILILSGDAAYEDKGAASFNNAIGQISLQGTGFSAQIKAGTIYRILNISTVEIDVANINTKIGTNVDPAGTTTLFAWLARLFALGGRGLVYYGKVTEVVDATHFRASGLAGLGDAYFANTYRVYMVRDAAGGGAAPQGEMQPCSAYTSSDGTFTHTAFSVVLAVDDEVLLLHERLAEIADLIRQVAETTGTMSFDETSALEQDMVSVTITARAKIGGIWLDMVNVTQDTTIKVYHKIDGTNPREVSSSAWATTDSDGVLIEGFTAYRDIKVTLTCGGGGAASVNVPYAIV